MPMSRLATKSEISCSLSSSSFLDTAAYCTDGFSGDGDFTAVTRVGSALQLTIHGAGKVQTGATLPFLLPITVIGNQSGASFNFIISFDIPDNLKSTMGTGYEKPSVQYAAVSRKEEDDREQEISYNSNWQ